MQSRRFTRLGILNKMMTFKIRYHCDYFSIRLRFELIEGGAGWGLPPFHQSAFGPASHCAGPSFFQARERRYWPAPFELRVGVICRTSADTWPDGRGFNCVASCAQCRRPPASALFSKLPTARRRFYNQATA